MRKMMKKFIATFLVVAIVLCSSPLSGLVGLELPDWLNISIESSAESYSGTCGTNAIWNLDTDTGLLAISGSGGMANYISYPYAPWWSFGSSIISVSIGDSVTSIGDYAFRDCTNLTDVIISDNVRIIGKYAFYNCTNLTDVAIGDSVASIGGYTFENCTGLTSIIIPNSVTSIGASAFHNCTSLTNVTIGDSVTACVNASTFSNCTDLASITVDENNQYYSSDEYGVLFNKDKTTLIQYPIGNTRTSYIIPDSVTSIGDSAFRDCTSLTSISIPDSLTSIGDSAFRDCTSLTSISIPDSLTSIGDSAFRHCTSLTSVTIGDGVTSIGEYAFYNCTSLTGVTISDSVTSIGDFAFYDCGSLIDITIGDSVTSIGECVFYNTGYYNDEINWEDSALYLENYLLEANELISGHYAIKSGTTVIAEGAFNGLDSITSISIPNSVTSIGEKAFDSFWGLTSITIPNSVTSIGDSAFYRCDNLISVTIPDSVTSIGKDAFSYCTSLTSVTIPDSVTSIGDYAFYICRNLTDVYYSGCEEEWNAIFIGSNNTRLTNATIHYNSKTPFIESINFGVDRFSFGKDISGYIGDEISSLLVYTSESNDTTNLTITSSNSDIVEIGTINHGYGEYIGTENEHKATIPLKFKAEGTATITITSSDGLSESVNVIVNKSTYELKLYSDVPPMIVAKGDSIGGAIQLEKNGVKCDEDCAYTFACSNNNVATITDITDKEDGTFFTINGVDVGEAIITITENNSGAIYSAKVQVNNGVLTYNAEALPTYYDKKNVCNGYIGGMYIDEFKSTEKNDTTISVSFNVYNSVNIVGAVDVYDENGNLKESHQIKRFDGGFVTSITDTLLSGYYLLKDTFVTGDILTYRQSSYSELTKIELDVPKGGHIEITNDPTYSQTCSIFNAAEFVVSTALLFGDVVDISASKQKEVSEIVGKNVVDKFIKEYVAAISGDTYNKKIAELGNKFVEKFTEKVSTEILESTSANTISAFIDECKEIFIECDIDLVDLMLSSALSVGVSIAENTLESAMGLAGIALEGMFKASDYLSYSCFVVDICKPQTNHAMYIHFDDSNGCLADNGVSIKSETGDNSLSASNFVMHSVVLSNEFDLTNSMKDSLDNVSKNYVVRNIYLERDGVVSQPGQTVQVSIPVPDGYDINKCVIYWVKDDGTIEKIPASVQGNSLVFTTTHFSYYAILEIEEIIDCNISIQSPSITTIRCKDGIILHANLNGTYPEGTRIEWTSSNGNFDKSVVDGNSLKIISKDKGYTTFTATLYDADGNVLATDSVEMYSKAGFFDKIGGFFRNLFGTTKIYDN